MNTPRGSSQGEDEVMPGMISVHTAGHGGVNLSPELHNLIPKDFQRSAHGEDGWYEEDCDMAIPFYFLAQEIMKHGSHNGYSRPREEKDRAKFYEERLSSFKRSIVQRQTKEAVAYFGDKLFDSLPQDDIEQIYKDQIRKAARDRGEELEYDTVQYINRNIDNKGRLNFVLSLYK